jgi:hypothetical protein
MAKEKSFLHPVTVEVRESHIAALRDQAGKDFELGRELTRLAKYFIAQHADGGMMMTKRDLDALENACGKVFQSPREIVDVVSAAMGREQGQYTIKANVDPAFIEPLKEIAAFQNCTVDELLQNCINMALQNGWLYHFNSRDGQQIPFAGDAWDILCAFMGRGAFTGEEVAAKLQEVMAAQSARQEG